MNRVLVGFLVVLVVGVQAGAGYASGPPARGEGAGVSFKNASKTAADAIDLRSAGAPSVSHRNATVSVFLPLRSSRTSANPASLSADEERTLALEALPPTRLDRQRLPRIPLFWAGAYLEIVGITVEFPVISKEGGGR